MTLYDPKNEVQNTLAADYVHGTDTQLDLNDAGDFPAGGGIIRVDDGSEWALLEYTGISTNTLTGLTGARAVNESTASYTFGSGTDVYLVQAADYNYGIGQILKGNSPWPTGQDAGDNPLNNLLLQNFTAATELTISTGSITATQTMHTVDTEADAASDDLDTISGGSNGDILFLQAANDTRTVVLKHGTGNIYTAAGKDIALSSTQVMVKLVRMGGNWYLAQSPFRSACHAYLSANQLNLASDTNIQLEFDTVEFDVNGDFDTTNYEFVAPASGIYMVTVKLRLLSMSDGVAIRPQIYKNGSKVSLVQYTTGASGHQGAVVLSPVSLAEGDKIQGYGWHNEGSSLDVSGGGPSLTHMTISRLF